MCCPGGDKFYYRVLDLAHAGQGMCCPGGDKFYYRVLDLAHAGQVES